VFGRLIDEFKGSVEFGRNLRMKPINDVFSCLECVNFHLVNVNHFLGMEGLWLKIREIGSGCFGGINRKN